MWIPLMLLLISSCVQYAQGSMICPPKIKTFSSGAFKRSYFMCINEGDEPILVKCPKGHWYWPSKESCHPAPGNDAYDEGSNDLRQYSAPVLGRPVMLGSLTDATRNVIYPTESLWKKETVQSNKIVSTSYSSDVSFFAAQTTFERMAHMDITAPLKLEFLGGLISVEGSAAYLKDSVESEKTLAYILKAHYLTRSEMLPAATTLDYHDTCKLKDVTHVVTALTYGMDAYFAFKKTVKSDQSKEKIAGDLKVAIKWLPKIKVDAGMKVNISKSLKEMIKGIDAKLRGDFILDTQPTTYVESVLVFKNLTSQLGKKPEYNQASKMTMILTPIKRFCPESTAILLDISEGLVHRVTIMLDELERTKLKAKTLGMADAVRNYVPLQKILNLFNTKIDVFELEFKAQLQKILPKIRGGGADIGEKDLIQLLNKYTFSPFNEKTCGIFLKTRQREIESLDFILDPDNFRGTQVQVVDYEDAGDVKTLFRKKIVLMLKFNILPDVTIMEKFLDGKEVDESHSWFNNFTVVSGLGEIFTSFMAFAGANKNLNDRGYLVAMYDVKKKYVNVYAQKKQRILTDDFLVPEQPPPITITSNEYNSVTFHVEETSNPWVTGFILQSWKYGRKSDAAEKSFSFKVSNTYNVPGLNANEVYLFAIKYITAVGDSPYSEESVPVVTKPCSTPSSVRAGNITSSSATLHWELPLHIGKGVQIVDYTTTVMQGDVVIKKERTHGVRSITFKDLQTATLYNISLQAIPKIQKYNGSKGEKDIEPTSSKIWTILVTSPEHPSRPSLVEISYHSAQVVWSPPTRIAVGAVIKEYLTQYYLLNNLGDKSITGTNMEQSSKTKTSITLTDLVQGSTYAISVKVVTSMGTSDYSPVLIARTRYRETELDSLRRSVEKEIKYRVNASTSVLAKRIDRETSRINSELAEEATRIGNVKANLENRMDREKSRINYEFAKELAHIGDMKSDLQEKIQENSNELEYAIQLYYPKYNARFIGIGYGFHDGYEHKHNVSLEECIRWCFEKRRTESSSWNGLNYLSGNRDCECCQNDKGHKSIAAYVHYHLM